MLPRKDQGAICISVLASRVLRGVTRQAWGKKMTCGSPVVTVWTTAPSQGLLRVCSTFPFESKSPLCDERNVAHSISEHLRNGQDGQQSVRGLSPASVTHSYRHGGKAGTATIRAMQWNTRPSRPLPFSRVTLRSYSTDLLIARMSPSILARLSLIFLGKQAPLPPIYILSTSEQSEGCVFKRDLPVVTAKLTFHLSSCNTRPQGTCSFLTRESSMQTMRLGSLPRASPSAIVIIPGKGKLNAKKHQDHRVLVKKRN